MVRSQGGRDGTERVRSLRGKREESRKREKIEERIEKREERYDHDQDEKVEGYNGSIPEWRDGTEKGRSLRGTREESREKREERRGKSAERSEKRETSTIKMRGSKEAMVRSQNGGMVQKRFGP